MDGPVLYFSSYCSNSKRLLDKIRANFEVNKITFFDISSQRGKPAWVKKIPVLSIQGHIQGKTYIGNELFGLFDPPPPTVQEEPVREELDEHDPRARLNGMGSMSMNKQESTIPMRNGVTDFGGAFQAELEPYNAASLQNFSGSEALGALSEGVNDVLDLKAPPESMVLQDCEPFPQQGV